MHRASEYQFYVKRRYYDHGTTPEEDLNLPLGICKSLFEKIDITNAQVPLKAKAENKLKDEKEKLFSGGKHALEEYKKVLRNIMAHVIPRFERTRTVSLVPGQCAGEYILTCSCNRYRKLGMACRHIYAILNRYPRASDCKIRWFISYGYYYGRNNELSRQLVKMRDECNEVGVPITQDEWAAIDSVLS